METPDKSDWSEALRYIAERVEKTDARVAAIDARTYDMHGKVSGLEVKASIFGMVAGMIGAWLTKIGLGQ